ncbi:MAG: gliding motility-associated-like protein [Crocinitomix sp.]|jgi:gliding motility-associated-like protein
MSDHCLMLDRLLRSLLDVSYASRYVSLFEVTVRDTRCYSMRWPGSLVFVGSAFVWCTNLCLIIYVILLDSYTYPFQMFSILNHIRFIILHLLILIPSVGFTQYIQNPSFEKKSSGWSEYPPGWHVCKPNSSPDTQPGTFAVEKTANDGENYISLVTRGFLGPYAATTEEICSELMKPLVKDTCYSLDINLALSEMFGHEIENGSGTSWLSYANSVRIKIWGGTDMCNKTELLWTSDIVSHAEWENYATTIRPELSTLLYLFIEADYNEGASQYFGNILVDNIQISKFEPDETSTEIIGDLGESINLNATEGNNYVWNPDLELSCTNCQDPSFVLKESCKYQVTYEDQFGCIYKDNFNIWLSVIVPNIFTPNGDGINDTLYIQGLRPKAVLTIYNRWGVPVYYSFNYTNTWSGLGSDGNIVVDGVYFYHLVNGSSDNTASGSLHIVK